MCISHWRKSKICIGSWKLVPKVAGITLLGGLATKIPPKKILLDLWKMSNHDQSYPLIWIVFLPPTLAQSLCIIKIIWVRRKGVWCTNILQTALLIALRMYYGMKKKGFGLTMTWTRDITKCSFLWGNRFASKCFQMKSRIVATQFNVLKHFWL